MTGHRKQRRGTALMLAPLAASALILGTGSADLSPPARAAAPVLPAPPANGEMGFIFTHFAPAIYQGKEDCPEGLAATLRENYLQTQAPAERMRLHFRIV